ncbi:hypothetical protein B9W68_18395 [Streptomyces sp. CS227]|nr:hypothetical protein B9W68_18395 [Streptomyces sp. CS227]
MGAPRAAGAGRGGGGLRGQPAGDGGGGPVLPLRCVRSPRRISPRLCGRRRSRRSAGGSVRGCAGCATGTPRRARSW